MPVPASGVAGKSGMTCRDPAESGVLETHGLPRAFVSGEARRACPVRSPWVRRFTPPAPESRPRRHQRSTPVGGAGLGSHAHAS